MNKNVTRPLSLALVCALAVPTASLARTVSVAAIKDGAATAAFGDPDGAAYTLAWGYGPADGGDTTNSWAHFETLGAVAADATAATYPLPAGWGDTATHLRFFLLEPEIPTAATRVEYIAASGTQWIDTGVNGETGLKFRADLEWDTSHNGKADWVLVGARNGTASSDYTRIVPIYIEKAVCFGYGRFVRTTTSTVLGVRHEIVTDFTDGSAVSISRDGTPITGYESGYYPSTGTVDAGRNLYIFAANWGGSANLFAKAKLYGLEIQRKNATTGALEPVRNFVPCTTNGVACLYDTVERRYHGNSGTGSFSAGATLATPIVVAAISATASAADYGEPDEYLDCVEATGSQYIDSGVNLCSNDTVVAEYEITAALTKTADLFGVHQHGMTARYVFSYSSGSGSSTIVFHRANGSNGATTTSTGVTVTPGARQTVTMKIGPGTSSIVSASGETLYSATLTTRTVQQDATGSLAIFACNSSPNGIMAYCPAKLYSFRIYAEDGSLTHHFLPCKKNDVAGLYDKATGKILFATGGSLVAGPVLPRPAELVEWVQSDGASGDRQLYIDTGVPAKAGTGMTAELLWPAKPSVASTVCGAMADATHHFSLYTSAGTHQIGYANYSAFQVNSGTSAVYSQKRYRISSSLTAKAQNIQVEDLEGTGYNGSRFFNDANSIDAGNNLYLFARNDAGTPNQLAKARLYSLVLTNELGVARDFVPCVANNGRAGLYDRFSERVFFPQTAVADAAADFDFATEVGAVTNSLVAVAEPPKRLRYIESDGTSDFVNLGVIGRENVKMVAEMEWAAVPPGNDYNNVFCGASANGVHIWPYIGVADANSSAATPRMGYNGWRLQVTGTFIAADTRYRITTSLERKAQSILVEKFQNGNWVVDGNGERTNNDANWVNTQLPLYLFADNAAGTASNFVAARVYSLKLWQLNATSGEYELVRDLVPAKLDSGAAVLWDKVEARPLFNGARYGFAATGRETAWNGPGFMIRFW
ncbi:MAG: hypothetical protein IJ678_06745 [Kiritimatiellae bacterium]|nr:hypothetical protein [Kiritimatiellia bacterium]